MATRRDPRFKECRRFGVNVYGHPKALKRVRKDQRQKKMSEYGTQLLEKQKLRAYYNLLERQFVRYYDKAKKMEGVTCLARVKPLPGFEGRDIRTLTAGDVPKSHKNLGKAVEDASLTFRKFTAGEIIPEPPSPFRKLGQSVGVVRKTIS